jgi:hypothetical protein
MKALLLRGGFGCGLNGNKVVATVRDGRCFELATQGRSINGIGNFVLGRGFGFDK